MIFNDYTIWLSTGEELQVTEIADLEFSKSGLEDVEPVLSLCTKLSHRELEEAKEGYDSALKSKMKSPPVGCLLRFEHPICAEIKRCSMADPKKCSTKHTSRGGGKFPICWTCSRSLPKNQEQSDLTYMCNIIVHAWRQGRHVIVVMPV